MRYAAEVVLLGIAGSGLAWLACSAPAPVIQNAALAADVAAYTAEQGECVNGSANLAAARACLASVRAKWCGYGGQLQQAGGCGQDAGHDVGMPLPASVVSALGLPPSDAGGQ